jgi:hypothetical protein
MNMVRESYKNSLNLIIFLIKITLHCVGAILNRPTILWCALLRCPVSTTNVSIYASVV